MIYSAQNMEVIALVGLAAFGIFGFLLILHMYTLRNNRTHRRTPSGGAPVPYKMPQTQPEPVQAPPVAPTPPAAPAPPVAPPAPPAAPAAPPAPPPPPASSVPGAPPPPGPPPPPSGGPPPAPPPPAPSASSPDDGSAPTGLAAALATRQKKLKKVETSEPDSAPGAAANKPPISGGGPMDHMNELQRKIALRANKANTEDTSPRNVSPSPTPTSQNRESTASTAPTPWVTTTNGNKITNGAGSPKLTRRDTSPAKKWGTLPSRIKRNPSIGGAEPMPTVTAVTGSDSCAISNPELEALKQEILTEMRKEINKMKQEILEAKRESPR